MPPALIHSHATPQPACTLLANSTFRPKGKKHWRHRHLVSIFMKGRSIWEKARTLLLAEVMLNIIRQEVEAVCPNDPELNT